MHAQERIESVASSLLQSKGMKMTSCKPMRMLWAGYGQICALKAISTLGEPLHLILKYVSPRVEPGEHQDEGHVRKVISYQVEQYFYTHLAHSMPPEIAVASCLASIDAHDDSENTTAMILSDLRQAFPVEGETNGYLNRNQIEAAIDWLAAFHGFWWTRCHELSRDMLRRPPLQEIERKANGVTNAMYTQGSVWLNGGYTYLATRRSEYANMAENVTPELVEKLCAPSAPSNESIAERVAKLLSPTANGNSVISEYETLTHGDVKSENLFTTTSGDAVAFYDFQYVGLGLGVCDLAKLFTCSVPKKLLRESASDGLMHTGEESLLRRYLEKLESISGKKYAWDVFVRHWEVAVVDWLRFQASWGFWGNSRWLEARSSTILEDQSWHAWLNETLDSHELSRV